MGLWASCGAQNQMENGIQEPDGHAKVFSDMELI